MRQVIVISGRTCSGKSKLAKNLKEEFGFHLVRSGQILADLAERQLVPRDRISLQSLGDEKDSQTSCGWLAEAVRQCAKNLPDDQGIVVDNARNWEQINALRSVREWRLVHVHLYAPTTILESRFQEKRDERPEETAASLEQADLIKNEKVIDRLKDDADIRIQTGDIDGKCALVRVAARLGLYAPPERRCVDVVVGGQYGSEGKGHLVAYLAQEYDVVMRVGGPNAGHTVSSESGIHIYHHLPSGTKDIEAKILLGAGMTIRPEKLVEEIEDCSVSPARLCIDGQAMIIEDRDLEDESNLVQKIASTGRGGGAAAARRILGRKPGAVRLARDVPELRPYIGSTLEHLERAYREGRSVLLEGTQGSGLSLFHGPYPYVTSRDTNVAGCLAEAGISPTRVRRVVLVVRSTPIRVGHPEGGTGDSGPLKYERAFEDIALRAGLEAGELLRHEKTSTTKRQRRIGLFEWDLFRRACALNAPTDIALTFADYLNVGNRKARRFEQLDKETIKFIEELEAVGHAPVSLINTRFPREGERLDLRSVIDRRHWSARQTGSGCVS